jgi:hypothetical protein
MRDEKRVMKNPTSNACEQVVMVSASEGMVEASLARTSLRGLLA